MTKRKLNVVGVGGYSSIKFQKYNRAATAFSDKHCRPLGFRCIPLRENMDGSADAERAELRSKLKDEFAVLKRHKKTMRDENGEVMTTERGDPITERTYKNKAFLDLRYSQRKGTNYTAYREHMADESEISKERSRAKARLKLWTKRPNTNKKKSAKVLVYKTKVSDLTAELKNLLEIRKSKFILD